MPGKLFALWVSLFISSVALADANVVYTESFKGDPGGLTENWTQVSSSGGFQMIDQGSSGVLAVQARPNDERVGIRQSIDLPAGAGSINLRAKVRWLQGEGKVFIRVQSEPDYHLGRHDKDLAKLEYRNAPDWHWDVCWTRYQGGSAPTPQPVQQPRLWSEANVDGQITEPLPDAVLLIQVQPANRSDNQIFKVQIDEIEITYTAKNPVSASVNQTCWTSGPVLLTLANEGPSTEVSCQLVDARDEPAWQQSVNVPNGEAVTVAIPRPTGSDEIQNYQLRVDKGSATATDEPMIAEWRLWMPPEAIVRLIDSWLEAGSTAASDQTQTGPRFEYWSADIPGGRASIVAPDQWTEVREANPTQSEQGDADGDGLVVYEPLLQSTASRHEAPGSRADEAAPTLAFAGKRAIRIVGVRALRDIENLHVEIDEEQLPAWLVNRVQLRQMLFMPKGTEDGFSYIPGPYVVSEAGPLAAKHNARYAVVVELPEEMSEGDFEVPLRITYDGRAVDQRCKFRVLPLELGESPWRFSLFSGPYGHDRQRGAFYSDMAAMGLDFPAIYNLSPCHLAYEEGELKVTFDRFENELKLLRNAGLLQDGGPMLIDMRFIAAQVTDLSTQLNENPELRHQTVSLRQGSPDLEPNDSPLEAALFHQVLEAIGQRSEEHRDLWPGRMLFMPQDEIEWGRIAQTARFGALIKEAGFETLATSDGVRWGWDGLERLDDVIDFRVYGYVSEDVLDVMADSDDAFGVYTYPHDFVIGWVYHASMFAPELMMKWTYYWPTGSYYKPGQPNPSAGTSYAWPGENAALPSDYTFEISEATRDAALLKLCRETSDAVGSQALTAACLARIHEDMLIDVKALTQQLARELPRGNARAWRQVMSAALLHDLEHQRE